MPVNLQLSLDCAHMNALLWTFVSQIRFTLIYSTLYFSFCSPQHFDHQCDCWEEDSCTLLILSPSLILLTPYPHIIVMMPFKSHLQSKVSDFLAAYISRQSEVNSTRVLTLPHLAKAICKLLFLLVTMEQEVEGNNPQKNEWLSHGLSLSAPTPAAFKLQRAECTHAAMPIFGSEEAAYCLLTVCQMLPKKVLATNCFPEAWQSIPLV